MRFINGNPIQIPLNVFGAIDHLPPKSICHTAEEFMAPLGTLINLLSTLQLKHFADYNNNAKPMVWTEAVA